MLSLKLRSAATDGDVAELERYLRSVRAEERDDLGCTPLIYAAWGGAVDLTHRLLGEKGCELQAANHDGQTALHLAAAYGRVGTVEVLLRSGANVNARDKVKYTPLHMAAEAQWGVVGWEGSGGRDFAHHRQVLRLLLDYGADPIATDTFGRKPLDMVCDDPEMIDILRRSTREGIHARRPYPEKAPEGSVSAATASASAGAGAAAAAATAVAASAPASNARSPPVARHSVDDWDTAAVCAWFARIGFSQYVPVLQEKQISGKTLLKITDKKLAKLVADEFHRERILQEIEKLKGKGKSPMLEQWTTSNAGSDLQGQEQLRLRQRAEEMRRIRQEQEVLLQRLEERYQHDRLSQEAKKMKSRVSSKNTVLVVDNNTNESVRVYWMDYSGEPQLKKILDPLQVYREKTYEEQVWRVVDDRTSNVLREFVTSGDSEWVAVGDDPSLVNAENAPPPSYEE